LVRRSRTLAGLLGDLARGAVHCAEIGQSPEKPRIEELEQAPELSQMILDRRAGGDQAVPCTQTADGAGRCGRRVLDRLRLVEDAVVELNRGQDLDIPLDRAVGGQDEVELRQRRCVAPALGAMELENR
jgi:hypothetical protein